MESIIMKPIGVIHSPFTDPKSMPIQPELVAAAERIGARAVQALVRGEDVTLAFVPKGNVVFSGKLPLYEGDPTLSDRGCNVNRKWWVSRKRANELVYEKFVDREGRSLLLEAYVDSQADVTGLEPVYETDVVGEQIA